MFVDEIVARSPIRILDRMLGGGLGAGKLGAVVARSGVGKTAMLVQLALDSLLRGRRVLHLSNEAPVDHLRTYYDELFRELERAAGVHDAASVLLELERCRLLATYPGQAIDPARLQESVATTRAALGRDPELIVVEGLDLRTAEAEALEAIRALAARISAEVWLAARAQVPATATRLAELGPPFDRAAGRLDALVLLEPAEAQVRLRVLEGRRAGAGTEESLLLDPVTFQLLEARVGSGSSPPRSRARFTLHSGGAKGAEAAFGAMAERYGLGEVTFSFEGHRTRVRGRGLRLLSEPELRVGDVSLRYVSHRLGRVFPADPDIRRVIQSIWHQIRPCQQVFVVGQVQADGTVRGGTGWGAELARRWGKELFVFDQGKDAWFRWTDGGWVLARPEIRSPAFAGTGTCRLEPSGLRAIEALFEASFGPGDSWERIDSPAPEE
jgi:hypothetical protein